MATQWGDRYIHEAAVCFLRNIPDGTLCARVSGDEFNILFCGYDSREAVQRAIDRLVSGVENSHFNLPDWTGHAHSRFRRHRVVSGGRNGVDGTD